MHLRGPMNISQLAVYQVPSEAFKLRNRNTVPFYNRRRALKQRDINHNNKDNIQPLNKRTWTDSTNCSSATTVTSTVTVTSCASSLSSVSTALPNTTYVGPPLPCLPTSDSTSIATDPSHAPVVNSPSSNCTCRSPPTVTQNLERHPKIALRPMPTQPPRSISDTAEIRKRAAAWDRVAYYTSVAPAQATGFSFLANLGDPRQSGTFD